ncbi:hypothetical protein AAG906_016522 [Vitis piasezkii]
MMARPPRWTEVEDRVLFECKRANMNLRWPDIAKLTGLGRSGKSCRERYKNHLDPDVKRGEFSKWEDDSIIYFQSLHENSWTRIAKDLGRTDNDVKNRWYNHLKKKKQLGKSTADQLELPPLDSEFMPTEEVIKCFSD